MLPPSAQDDGAKGLNRTKGEGISLQFTTVQSVDEIAKRIKALTGSSSEIVYRPLPEDDPKVRQPDITRARKLLGWEPKIGLEEGLKHTIEYFRGKVVPGK